MNIPEEVWETHQDLSAVARRFLEYLRDNAAALARVDSRAEGLPDWVRRFPFTVQTWPAFVGEDKLRPIRRATVQLTRLIKSIPERVFGNDPKAVTGFYGFPSEALVGLLLEPPNGIGSSFARCDFVDSASGLKCIEVNMSAFLGGWQLRFWEAMCRNNPAIADFLAREGVEPTYHDPLRTLFTHIVEDTLHRRIGGENRVNLAVVMPTDFPLGEGPAAHFNELYARLLAERFPGLDGEVSFSTYPTGLVMERGSVWCGRNPVDAVVEYTEEPTPEAVYRGFKAGMIGLYNGPLKVALGDKRNLALLSSLEDSELFAPEERAVIRAHLPWSREVRCGSATYRGEEVDLSELLTRRRSDFVLKPMDGSGGEGVLVGLHCAPQVWARRVEEAAAGGGWLAQEYVRSRSYLFQHGEAGAAVHDVVWGMFCFGSTYGGGFLRLSPRGSGAGVINAARGAEEGLILEV